MVGARAVVAWDGQGPVDDHGVTAQLYDVPNLPPAVAIPAAQVMAEDSTRTFTTSSGTGIAVSDADGGSGVERVTLTSSHGVLTLGTVAGLTFSAGDGTADATITFAGTLSALNAALNGLVFAPSQDYNGPASVGVTIDDRGNTGSGGALTASASVSVTVTAVNDAPVLSVPGAQTRAEDTAAVFSAASADRVSIVDTDAGTAAEKVTLAATRGADPRVHRGPHLFCRGRHGRRDHDVRRHAHRDQQRAGRADVHAGGELLRSRVAPGHRQRPREHRLRRAQSASASVPLTLTAVADTPTVTGAATLPDTQTTTGLIVSRNAADGAEVGYFKVTSITGGSLFQNDGVTPVASGQFLTYAQAHAGLKFTPASGSAGGRSKS